MSNQDILILLQEKLSRHKIIDYAFTVDEHNTQKGKGQYIHAYFELDWKFDTKNQKFFDLPGNFIINKETGVEEDAFIILTFKLLKIKIAV